MKAAHPEIPWRRIAGIGNILRHEYRSISTEVIWETAQAPLRDLKRVVLILKADLKKTGKKKDEPGL